MLLPVLLFRLRQQRVQIEDDGFHRIFQHVRVGFQLGLFVTNLFAHMLDQALGLISQETDPVATNGGACSVLRA